MESTRPYVINDFPYPIAYPYSLVFKEDERPSIRRWALCFTEYQMLRMVCLPLVGQYLREPIDESAQQSISALNRAIAAIRSPFFNDWITLLMTLHRHLPKVGIDPLFPRLDEAIEALKDTQERAIGLRDRARLNPLEAILALRNATAHGGMPEEAEAERHVELYTPVLHQVLDAVHFLGVTMLKVCCDAPLEILSGRASVRTLRGVQLGEAVEEELTDTLMEVFQESATALVGPDDRIVPLYPLFNPIPEREPLYLYDGHYGICVQTSQGTQERSYIYYLGVHHRTEDSPACERLKELLGQRQINFFLAKEQTAPWTIVDNAVDYSRRTLEELIGTKYFPECYLPFEGLERHVKSFLQVPRREHWSRDTTRRRYVNGFFLTGLAGAGKTAFLARQVEQLLQGLQKADGAGPGTEDIIDRENSNRENRNLVLFLRGNGITLRPEGLSLFRDVAERLGVAVESATSSTRFRGGFSSFRELLEHLHGRWRQDRVEDRCLILVLDALNEAPFAEKVVREALEMVGVAACFPWCKVVISTRQEWLRLWSGKMGAQEMDPLEDLRPFLYVSEPPGSLGQKRAPVVAVEPFTEEQARQVYERYQAAAQDKVNGGAGSGIAACRTPWDELPAATRDLLTKPLYLHLFMEAFGGYYAEPVETVPVLFRQYVDRALRQQPGLREAVHAVMEHLLSDIARSSADLTDNDCNALRRVWAEGHTAEEIRLNWHPVEGIAHEGLVIKRVREEGGGYRFVFQTVAEYLVYWQLLARKPGQEQEVTYWTQRAAVPEVFTEYAGAFLFLLRDWATQGQLTRIGPLIEAASDWLRDKVVEFLLDQALTNHSAGKASESARRAAAAMAQTGGRKAADTLQRSAYLLVSTRFAAAAAVYYKASATIYEHFYESNIDDTEGGATLAGVLNALAASLVMAGSSQDAKPTFLQAIEVYKKLRSADPRNRNTMRGLAIVLSNFCNLLRGEGRFEEAAERAGECIELLQAMGDEASPDANNGDEAGAILINLGMILVDMGDFESAETVFRRARDEYARLRTSKEGDLDIDAGLALSLSNLANLLFLCGDMANAESVYHSAGSLYEQLWKSHPSHVDVGEKFCMVMSNNAILLRTLGRIAEAEKFAEYAVALSGRLQRSNPQNLDVGCGHVTYMITLAIVYETAGRLPKAEEVYRATIQTCQGMVGLDPENAESYLILARAWAALGRVLGTGPRRLTEAKEAFKQALNIYEGLIQDARLAVYACSNLAETHAGLGEILEKEGDLAEADECYRQAIALLEAGQKQNPHYVDMVSSLAYYLNKRARLLRNQSDETEVQALLERSADIYKGLRESNPEHIDIKLGYASCLQAMKRWAEAETLINEVLRTIPEHPVAKELRLKGRL